jgi:hypothetical protein
VAGAGLYVASSDCDDAVKAFRELSAEERMPPLMASGVMDPGVLKHYVLLHDVLDGNSES